MFCHFAQRACCAPPLPLLQADVQAIATIATLQSLTLSGAVYFTYYTDGGADEEILNLLDLSWLGALPRLRKLDLQGLWPDGELQHLIQLHLGDGGSSGNSDPDGSASGGSGTDSGCRGRSLPPCLEELLLPKAIELDGPSVRALAGLQHLTRLSAALNSRACRALEACPPEPLAVTLRHIELWLCRGSGYSATPAASSLPVVARLLAAKPPAALRLTVNAGNGTTAQHLLALREVAERVREVALLTIISCGEDKLQVCRGQGYDRAHALVGTCSSAVL